MRHCFLLNRNANGVRAIERGTFIRTHAVGVAVKQIEVVSACNNTCYKASGNPCRNSGMTNSAKVDETTETLDCFRSKS